MTQIDESKIKRSPFLQKEDLPPYMQLHYDMDMSTSMTIVESLTIQRLIDLPDENLSAEMINGSDGAPKTKSGIVDAHGDDVHGKNYKCLRIEKLGKFGLVVMRQRSLENDWGYRVISNSYQ